MRKSRKVVFIVLVCLLLIQVSVYCKSSKPVFTLQVFNALIGPVSYQSLFKTHGDVRIKMYKTTSSNSNGRLIVDMDIGKIKQTIKNCYNSELKKKMKEDAKKGILTIRNLNPGKYMILFTAKDELQYKNTKHYFEITVDGKLKGLPLVDGVYRYIIELSFTGTIFYYSLISIVFLTFFIGIALIVIQHVAFKGIPFISIFGSSIVILSWAVVLGKLPSAVRIPVFLVQLVIYILAMWKKDLSSMPLPFLTKSYIQSKMDFLFQPALLLHDLSGSSEGIVRLRDKWHNILTLKARRYCDAVPLSKGQTVYLIDYDEKSDIYYVQSDEELHGIN